MENLNAAVVEETILEVLKTVTQADTSAVTMDTDLMDLNLKSIELISLSALLDEKLGEAPNFRALMSMKKVRDIRDYILR
jgi:acyl carrier protein